jgi:hypothetical protein
MEPDRTQLDYPSLTLQPRPALPRSGHPRNVTSGPFGPDRYLMMDSQPGS